MAARERGRESEVVRSQLRDFLAPLWPIGLQTVWMCCMLRAAALPLIGSLTLSDQLCACVGVVLTGRVEGTDFRLIKRCLGTKKGLCRETPPYPGHCCVNMPTSKVAPAYLSVREFPAKGSEAAAESEPCVRACVRAEAAGAHSEDVVLLHSECCEHQIVRKFAACFANSQF